MIFNRKSVWTLCALVSLSCQPVQAMEQDDMDIPGRISQNAKSVEKKTEKKKEPLKTFHDFSKLPEDLRKFTLELAFQDKEGGFRKAYRNLSLVSKEFSQIVKENGPKWISTAYDISKEDHDVFWRFYKGKLIYTDPDTKAQTVFPISSLSNPLRGEFDLSTCGKTGEDLSINVGYREGKNPKNAKKVEIWVAPRFLIERDLSTTATHFGPIMADWSQEKAQVGMFWTWGRWDNLDWYDYLTKDSMDDMGAENLLKKYQKSPRFSMFVCVSHTPFALLVKNFTFCL